ncbi:MAG: T9SS type A sorting domain-containing protein, partial [Sphingobacteriales bacterium]
AAWTEIGNSYDSLVDGNGFVVSDDALIDISSGGRYYALGHITTANDPLPVLYDDVVAYEKNDGVNVEWSNLTERDIAIYYVERSFNGMDYTIIGQYLPESNRDDKASYLHFDNEKTRSEVFYRIKAIGKNTKIIFSKVMRIDAHLVDRKNLNLYPNPVTHHQFALSLANLKEGSYPFRITTITGQEIYNNVLVNQGSFTTKTFKLPASIKAGIYSLTITGSDYYENRMFIVQ